MSITGQPSLVPQNVVLPSGTLPPYPLGSNPVSSGGGVVSVGSLPVGGFVISGAPVNYIPITIAPNWDAYLPPGELPKVEILGPLIEDTVMAWAKGDGDRFFSYVFKITEQPKTGSMYRIEILAKNLVASVNVGVAASWNLTGTKNLEIIQRPGEPLPAPEQCYRSIRTPKPPPIDLNYFKHTCPRPACQSPALLMFTSVECSKCGKF